MIIEVQITSQIFDEAKKETQNTIDVLVMQELIEPTKKGKE